MVRKGNNGGTHTCGVYGGREGERKYVHYKVYLCMELLLIENATAFGEP